MGNFTLKYPAFLATSENLAPWACISMWQPLTIHGETIHEPLADKGTALFPITRVSDFPGSGEQISLRPSTLLTIQQHNSCIYTTVSN